MEGTHSREAHRQARQGKQASPQPQPQPANGGRRRGALAADQPIFTRAIGPTNQDLVVEGSRSVCFDRGGFGECAVFRRDARLGDVGSHSQAMHNSAGRQNPHAVPPPPQTHWPGWQAWQPHFPRIRGVCGPSSMKESGSDWASPPRALETGAVPMAPMLFDIIIANGHPCHSITPSPELGNPAPFAQPTYICKYAWRAGLMADGPVLAPVRLAPACFISQRVGFISSGPPRWLSTPIRPLPGPIVGAGRESIACLQFPPRTGRLKSTAKSKTGLDQTPRRLHGEGPRFLAWLLCLDEKRQRGRGAARQVAASTVANCMAPGGRPRWRSRVMRACVVVVVDLCNTRRRKSRPRQKPGDLAVAPRTPSPAAAWGSSRANVIGVPRHTTGAMAPHGRLGRGLTQANKGATIDGVPGLPGNAASHHPACSSQCGTASPPTGLPTGVGATFVFPHSPHHLRLLAAAVCCLHAVQLEIAPGRSFAKQVDLTRDSTRDSGPSKELTCPPLSLPGRSSHAAGSNCKCSSTFLATQPAEARAGHAERAPGHIPKVFIVAQAQDRAL
ncbi:hypothetical protein Purlil1_3460 [Purpureocillium lilacinum]|uniref:Uncharacterized protein n=1 Tax=Purpureocillium lilacinum TaxID=33203 RepID=A0ABR0C7H2_PURLI|nr:hypothetical protein Purlil1_3460 [Purpureocillium lilacinum]